LLLVFPFLPGSLLVFPFTSPRRMNGQSYHSFPERVSMKGRNRKARLISEVFCASVEPTSPPTIPTIRPSLVATDLVFSGSIFAIRRVLAYVCRRSPEPVASEYASGHSSIDAIHPYRGSQTSRRSSFLSSHQKNHRGSKPCSFAALQPSRRFFFVCITGGFPKNPVSGKWTV